MFNKNVVATVLIFGLVSVSYGGVRYVVTDIGKLRMYKDSGYSCATSINNNGQVVGYSSTNLTPDFSGPTLTHAFIWTKENGIVDLTPNDTTGAGYRANDINDSGTIVGTVEIDGIKPFIWSSSNPSITMIDIGAGIVSSYELTRINNHGYITLNVAFPNQEEKGYIWSDTKGLVELPSLPNLFEVSPHTRAYALNDSDPPRAVGYSVFRLPAGSANKRAVQWDFNNQDNLYHPYDIDSITDPYGTGFSVARAISENDIMGTLVYSWDTPGYYPFIYNPSIGFEFLPNLGGITAYPNDINNKQQVVGTSEIGQPYSSHAFLWSIQTGIIDLHPFIVQNPKFQGPDDQSYVSSINDHGQIVGCANQRAFLLDPIPVFDLNITKDGSGNGTVTSGDGGINCGITCSASYDVGTNVNLTASPDTGSTFTNWGGECSGTNNSCTVTMDAAKSVTANFTLNTYSITTSVNLAGAGTVSCTPNPVPHGGESICTANAAAGYTFTSWIGNCSIAVGNICTLSNVTSDQTLTANFDLAGPAFSINNMAKNEGNKGTTNFTFTVTLSPASTQKVTVQYETADGTATAGYDYTSTSGTLTFKAGQTSKAVTVKVIGDKVIESDETFFVNLSSPTGGALLFDDQGDGIIRNDD